MKSSITQQQTGNRQVGQLQSDIAGGTQQLRQGPFGDGVLVTGLSFSGGTSKVVNHGLGRDIQGWVVVRIQGDAASTGFTLVETASDDKTCTLLPRTTATAAIWFW